MRFWAKTSLYWSSLLIRVATVRTLPSTCRLSPDWLHCLHTQWPRYSPVYRATPHSSVPLISRPRTQLPWLPHKQGGLRSGGHQQSSHTLRELVCLSPLERVSCVGRATRRNVCWHAWHPGTWQHCVCGWVCVCECGCVDGWVWVCGWVGVLRCTCIYKQ